MGMQMGTSTMIGFAQKWRMWPNIGADSDAPHIRISVIFYLII